MKRAYSEEDVKAILSIAVARHRQAGAAGLSHHDLLGIAADVGIPPEEIELAVSTNAAAREEAEARNELRRSAWRRLLWIGLIPGVGIPTLAVAALIIIPIVGGAANGPSSTHALFAGVAVAMVALSVILVLSIVRLVLTGFFPSDKKIRRAVQERAKRSTFRIAGMAVGGSMLPGSKSLTRDDENGEEQAADRRRSYGDSAS
ncbi:MAG TPA: hypothetical protein VGI39_41230 [Polyangiaceae bacterium]